MLRPTLRSKRRTLKFAAFLTVLSLISFVFINFRRSDGENVGRGVSSPTEPNNILLSPISTNNLPFQAASIQLFKPATSSSLGFNPFQNRFSSVFDSVRFEYFSLSTRSGVEKNGVSSVTLGAYFTQDGKKHIGHATFTMRKIAPEKCAVHSFLEESGILFMSCEVTHDPEKEGYDFLLMGFWYDESKSESGSGSLDLLLAKMLNVQKDPSPISASPHISLVQPLKFYIPINEIIWIVERKGGSLVMERSIPLVIHDVVGAVPSTIYPSPVRLSPKGRYYFSTFDNAGAVVETLDDQLVRVDDSCFAKTPESVPGKTWFYNDTVDPFIQGPYKTVSNLFWSADERRAIFEQTYCSGGGCAREGRISVNIGENKVTCDITVKYESLEK